MAATFSILTPNFNQGRFLDRNIQSVRQQDVPNVEHIVIDGGSKDQSVDVLKRHSSHLAHWVSEPDHGQADALCKALKHATGDYVGWLNADEFYEPNVLSHVRDAFAANADTVLVYGDVRRVDAQGEQIRINRQWRFDFDVCRIQTPIIINCGAFFRRDRLLEVGGFDSTWQYLMDWEMYIRFMRGGQKWTKLRRVVGNFTMHERSKTATAQPGFEAEIQRLQHREFPDWTQEQIDAHKKRQHQRMVSHMMLDGVLFEKAWFKLVRQRQYAHLFGDSGARLPVISRMLDIVIPASNRKPARQPAMRTAGEVTSTTTA